MKKIVGRFCGGFTHVLTPEDVRHFVVGLIIIPALMGGAFVVLSQLGFEPLHYTVVKIFVATYLVLLAYVLGSLTVRLGKLVFSGACVLCVAFRRLVSPRE